MIKPDGEKVLIVGYGISGGVRSHQLEQFGCKVYAVDLMPPVSSSKVAADMFNPMLIGRQKPVWIADSIF